MRERSQRNYGWMIWPALIIIFLDQASKLAILRNLRVHEAVPIINGLFNLAHVRNRGMAFGFLNRPDLDMGFYLLVGASMVAIGFILVWFIKLKEDDRLTVLALSLILGGAVGNLIDRIRLGEVVDFLDFYVGPHHFPAFNVADSSITVGTILLAFILFVSQKRHSDVS